jgi:LacI family transcriptional regulator
MSNPDFFVLHIWRNLDNNRVCRLNKRLFIISKNSEILISFNRTSKNILLFKQEKKFQPNKNKRLSIIYIFEPVFKRSCSIMSSKKKITIRDIARDLNTTISTVSRALQDHPRIGAEMRERIKKYAAEHDYRPDYRAASLRSGNAYTIGVLVPRIDIHFFAKVLRGIDDVASEKNYNVLIIQSHDSLAKEVNLVKSMVYGKVDGLIASISIETSNGDHFLPLLENGLPLVLFDKIIDSMDVHKVIVDDRKGAYDAVTHLIMGGCRRIAHFGGPQFLNIYRQRTLGYLDALSHYGITVDESLIFHQMLEQEDGYNAMVGMLALENRPDGVFSSNDFAVLGAIKKAKEAGIRVPQEMAFTGFANEPMDEIFEPGITSVEQFPVLMGQESARLLIEQLEKKSSAQQPRTIMINPKLIIRESSMR